MGITHRQQNIKTANKLLMRGGGGEDNKNIKKPYGGGDQINVIETKPKSPSPHPPLLRSQASNSDSSESNPMP